MAYRIHHRHRCFSPVLVWESHDNCQGDEERNTKDAARKKSSSPQLRTRAARRLLEIGSAFIANTGGLEMVSQAANSALEAGAKAGYGDTDITAENSKELPMEKQIAELENEDWTRYDYPTRRTKVKVPAVLHMTQEQAERLITEVGKGLGSIQRNVLDEVIRGHRRSVILWIDPTREDKLSDIRKYMLDVLGHERYALLATMRRAKLFLMREVGKQIEAKEKAKYTEQEIAAYLDKQAVDREAAKWQKQEEDRLRRAKYGSEIPTGIGKVFWIIRAIWRSIVQRNKSADLGQ